MGIEKPNIIIGVIKGLNGKPIKCTEKVNFLESMDSFYTESSIKRWLKNSLNGNNFNVIRVKINIYLLLLY